MTTKQTISTKVAKLHTLPELSPGWNALAAEIYALRASEPNPLANIKPGVYSSGRRPFIVAR